MQRIFQFASDWSHLCVWRQWSHPNVWRLLLFCGGVLAEQGGKASFVMDRSLQAEWNCIENFSDPFEAID